MYDLPDELVEYVPQYEGYQYAILEDEIVLIDPDSREIVAVIPE